MNRGQIINHRAFLGSQLVRLRATIPELEKVARRTPPKTLLSEKERVRLAKVALEKARLELVETEREYLNYREWERAWAWEAA